MTAPRGAYGLEILGVDRSNDLTAAPVDGRWSRVLIAQRAGQRAGPDGEWSWCTTDRAHLRIGAGMRAAIDRREGSAVLLMGARCDDDFLIHPFLSAPGAVFAWWEGREALHGGAFLAGDSCFALLGQSGSGKSSTLAELARGGHRILCDDLLVVRGTTALAGPRCLDLRSDAAAARAQTRQGGDERRAKRRLRLAPVAPEVPLRGVFFLDWGQRLEVGHLRPGERLPRLAASRTLSGSRGSKSSLIELARLPAWELRRPQRLSSLEPSVDRILALTGS